MCDDFDSDCKSHYRRKKRHTVGYILFVTQHCISLTISHKCRQKWLPSAQKTHCSQNYIQPATDAYSMKFLLSLYFTADILENGKQNFGHCSALLCPSILHQHSINSSAMAERPRQLGDFNGVGHFEALDR